MLSLVACQRAGTIHGADGWERPEPFGAADAAGDRHDAGVPNLLPPTNDGDTPLSSRVSGAQAPDVSFGDRTAWHSGTATAGTIASPDFAGPRAGEHCDDSSTTTPPTVSATARPYSRLTGHSPDNTTAADLLDHWGHRRVQGIVEGLSLGTAETAAGGAGTRELRPGALTGAGRLLARELEDGDEVRLLGARHGVTYGRWTGGPADTVSIEFDLSRAGPQMRYDPAFRALLERAGKAWSHRIADTWPTWERPPGDVKGWLWRDSAIEGRVLVGADGETSARLEIDVKDDDLGGEDAGRGGSSGQNASGRFWEPRFGTVRIDREYLEEAGERSLFEVLVHEVGHVVGAWTTGDHPPERVESHIDRAAGTWTGPNVVALHGGPAPFQDAANPFDSIDGERSPFASEFDFAHSGVCSSVMAYCGHHDPQPVFLPHAIDFAFLADMGLAVTEETDRPETYGLAGWTDHAGFSVSVSRDLRIDLADGQTRSNRGTGYPSALDITDRLQVEVDTFGYPGVGELLQSFPAEDLKGTVRYAGGLLGAAIDRTGLPPVTGSSSLAVNLGSLDGTASFTSLAVHAGGTPETFAGGSLHYPFNLSDNAIMGAATGSTLQAGFHGPRNESVAGTLHDPLAGLLASFGAARDDRPSREDIVASADYILGSTYRGGATGLGEAVAGRGGAGWSQYRCDAASGCVSRQADSDGWTDWAAITRSAVLASTAAWSSRSDERPHADHGFVRIARQADTFTGDPLAPRVVESRTGTLAHAAFGSGFEWSVDLSIPPDGAALDTHGHFDLWTGIQGTLSGARPDGSARWSGPMLGYQGRRPAGETSLVEGLASIEFSFTDNLLDVAFSEVASLDGERGLPDFAFEDLSVEEDGTFGRAGATGTMDGALFGPSAEEVAGAFHHETADVTGSFGARRVPIPPAPGDRGPVAPPPPVVDLDDALHVGADAAAPLDSLASGDDYGGVAVSSGEVRDGESAERVIEYLRRQIDDGGGSGRRTPGLPTLREPPTLHLAPGTSDAFAAYVERTVQLINTALPAERRIALSPEPAPPLTGLADVPEGRIFIDFAPSRDDWELGDRYRYTWTNADGIPVMVAEVDPTAEYDTATQRWEFIGMRAGRIWFDREVLETDLNTAWVRDWDTGESRRELLGSRPDESDSVQHYYSDRYVPRMTMSVLLRALGLLRRVDSADFPDSFLGDGTRPPTRHLPGIDGEALFAAYDRLAPGTLPEDLSAESLGPWDDTSFHLRGDLDIAGAEAAFGVAFRNGLARPWATGTAPLSELGSNSALFGTASWNGALLGVTPSAETVAGQARLTVELRTLDAELAFSGLEHWGMEQAPGAAGTGTSWGDGGLEYSVEIRGNAFHRAGGDDGEVVGAFFGAAHEAMGGVLERSDLAAGFGGVR